MYAPLAEFHTMLGIMLLTLAEKISQKDDILLKQPIWTMPYMVTHASCVKINKTFKVLQARKVQQ